MIFRTFSFKWWWYGLVEDLHAACNKELHDLEEKEIKKGHDWLTPKESLLNGWYSVSKENLIVLGPYHCIWESPQHLKIRSRYAGKIFQRRISSIPPIVSVIGGLLGIVALILQLIK